MCQVPMIFPPGIKILFPSQPHEEKRFKPRNRIRPRLEKYSHRAKKTSPT